MVPSGSSACPAVPWYPDRMVVHMQGYTGCHTVADMGAGMVVVAGMLGLGTLGLLEAGLGCIGWYCPGHGLVRPGCGFVHHVQCRGHPWAAAPGNNGHMPVGVGSTEQEGHTWEEEGIVEALVQSLTQQEAAHS